MSSALDLVTLILSGLVGGFASGFAVEEHRLGTIKRLIVGAVGGAGAYLLQSFMPLPPLSTEAGGTVGADSDLNHLFLMALVGLVAGGILALVLGFIAAEVTKHRQHRIYPLD